MTSPPARTAASGPLLSPLPALSLPLGRPCPCPRCVSACVRPLSWPAVSLSCLRPAVSLGLGLRAPPLRSRTRTPCAPSPPARDQTSCPRRRAFPGLRVTRRGGHSGWQPSRLRMPPALRLAGPRIPRPLGSRPQGPARGARAPQLGDPTPGDASSRRPAAGRQRACPEPAAAETRGRLGWAAGGACSAGAGPRARVRRKARAQSHGQLRRSGAARRAEVGLRSARQAGGRDGPARGRVAGCHRGGGVLREGTWGSAAGPPSEAGRGGRPWRGSGVRSPCARGPRPSAWPCPPSPGRAPRTERGAGRARARGPPRPRRTPTPGGRAGAPDPRRSAARPGRGVGKSSSCVTLFSGHFPALRVGNPLLESKLQQIL